MEYSNETTTDLIEFLVLGSVQFVILSKFSMFSKKIPNSGACLIGLSFQKCSIFGNPIKDFGNVLQCKAIPKHFVG